MRRRIAAAAAALRRVGTLVGGLALVAFCAVAAAQDFKVTLLGTGSPNPLPDRFGPSTLIEAGPEKLLFDAGRGASIRLWQAHVPIGSITATFISHFHSDHTVGIPDLWLTGWIQRPYGNRRGPFVIHGPTGTTAMMDALQRAYAEDLRIRDADEHYPMTAVAVDAHDFVEGVVYERNGVRVTAITVDHGDLIKPAFGFRIDYRGRSVVLSGDTRFSPHLIEAAKGADLVVHEVAATTPELLARSTVVQAIFAHHTSPQDAGRVFAMVKPKLAVYTHLVLIGDETVKPPSVDALIAQTRETYAGPLVSGRDLMQFVVTADCVSTVDPAVAPAR